MVKTEQIKVRTKGNCHVVDITEQVGEAVGRSRKGRCGSALVGLLVVGILVLLVLSVKWYWKKTAKDPDLCDDLTPWKEWRIREASEKPPRGPSEEQPRIREAIQFDTNAYLQGDPRGQIGFVIWPDGAVRGAWYDHYYKKPKINFDIMNADFEGRIYPGKIYRDENGEDTSKLYFIAKGNFLMAESDFDKNTLYHRGGDIYVRGWLNRDYSVRGKIIITSNEKHFEQFEWKALQPVRK